MSGDRRQRYGGRAVAKALDSHLDVTSVTERQQFLHNVAALRAVALDDYADELPIGYHKLRQPGAPSTAT